MDQISRGHRASELLADPLIVEALDGLEQLLQSQWLDSTTSEAREELWYTIKGMQRFKQYLRIAVENGDYEKALMEKRDA